MPAFDRFVLRLRRRLMRCYELAMLAVLLGLAISAFMPSARAVESTDPVPHCGKAQNSTAAMVR